MKRRDFLKYGTAGLAGLAFGGATHIPWLFKSRALASGNAWKFGVMADTQWRTGNNAGGEPASCAVSIINALNEQFIQHGVKFVIQVGDLVDREVVSGVRTLPTRLAATQALYDAGIGFYPVRGNHEATAVAANEIPVLFPQTLGTGPFVYGATNFESPVLPSTLTDPTGSRLRGLTYSFDFENVRCVLIDQFTRKDNTSYLAATGNIIHNNAVDQVDWVHSVLSSKSSEQHAFVFSHKNLLGQNHKDVLFGSSLTSNAGPRDQFIASLHENGVRYHISGHDHMHHRSIVSASDNRYSVGQLICSSNSYKFYIPREGDDGREIPSQQELFSIGYYIFTVDGPRVTVDFYASSHGSDYGDIDLVTAPSEFNFYLRETFGYSLNGRQFLVGQGESYAAVQDSHDGTDARILGGKNGNKETDYVGRNLTKTVNTGWASQTPETSSAILSLWGMTDNLSLWDDPNRGLDLVGLLPSADESRETDVYTLAMTFKDERVNGLHLGNAGYRLAARDDSGRWVNAVERNVGGRKRFIRGPWNSAYGLGTFGVDTATQTAWAVINHEGDFAVVRNLEG